MVVNEWWFGGFEGPAYATEGWALGSSMIQHLLYGGRLPEGLPPTMKVAIQTWRKTLKFIK